MKWFLYNFSYKFLNFLIPKLDNINFKTKHYGTYYGGYDLLHKSDIKICISCGLGEDASFDIELLKKYNCKIIIIDPTPRAIQHYKEIKLNFGMKDSKPYDDQKGKQSVLSYDLKNINQEKLIFLDKAITDINNSEIKLFFPNNKNHVSASLENDKNYSKKFFLAQTIDLENVLKKFQINEVDILKLDIEGGEISVLKNILNKKIFPKQILVEYKNIKSINIFKLFKIYKINKGLLKNGYSVININPKGDYTYLKIS